jgi:histone H3/H4
MAREPDRVWVLLDGRVGDLFRRLVQTGVDELEPRVAKDAGDHLAPAVMAVQARLGDDDPKLARHDRQSS